MTSGETSWGQIKIQCKCVCYKMLNETERLIKVFFFYSDNSENEMNL